jgi:branched-chain amino acid transport system substrate-binding protein
MGSSICLSAPAGAEEAIRVGVLAALTGPLAGVQPLIAEGAQLAADDINKNGGINGRKIEIIMRDTTGSPPKAISLAQQLIFNEKVQFLIGPGGSQDGLAATPVIAEARIPSFLFGSDDKLTSVEKYPLSIQYATTTVQYVEAMREFISSGLKAKKVAFIGDTTATGVFASQQISGVFEKHNEKPVYSVLIDPNKTDVSSEVAAAKEAGAEVIMAWSGATGMMARVINQVNDTGWSIPVLGLPSLGTTQLRDLLNDPAYWDKVYIGNYSKLTLQEGEDMAPETTEMIRLAKESKGDTIGFPLSYYGAGYDAMRLIATVVEESGDTDPDSFLKFISTERVVKGSVADAHFGPTRRYSFEGSSLAPAVASSLKDGVMSIAPEARK